MGKLKVWKKKKAMGFLRNASARAFSFQYNDFVESPVSYNLPVQTCAYSFHAMPAVFQSFIPEGVLRFEIVKHLESLQKRKVDDVDILDAIGGNSIGTLKLSKAEAEPGFQKEALSLSMFNQAEDELAVFKMQMLAFCFSGVSGVQPKFLANTVDGQRLIIKSYDPFEYPALTVVEQICMEIAGNIGLEVAKTSLSRQGHLLFVERFDIQDNEPKDMEELCSIMDHGTNEKYEGSYEQVSKHIALIHPESLPQLFKQLVFHIMIGNGDAHTKNFAILDGRLSPMYDAICTKVWLPRDQMALQLNGTKRWPSHAKLVAFGTERCGLNLSEAKGTIQAMKDGIISNLDIIEQHLNLYPGVLHIEPILMNLKEHILCGCGEKDERELTLQIISKLAQKG